MVDFSDYLPIPNEDKIIWDSLADLEYFILQHNNELHIECREKLDAVYDKIATIIHILRKNSSVLKNDLDEHYQED